MESLASRSVVVAALLIAAGCGGNPPAATHNVKIDAGGVVRYALGDQEALAGVTVTLTDVDGEIETTVTNSGGVWTLSNLAPGVYVESYSLAGYEPVTGTFSVPAGGENNVKNVFISRPDVFLSETPASASISPFDLVVRDGADARDGLAGVAAVYSSSANAAIAVTFTQRIANGSVRITDGETDQDVFATPNADDTVWTFSENALNTINGGGPGEGLTTDQDPFTWHQLRIDVSYYTPIHGDLVAFDAFVYFNAVD